MPYSQFPPVENNYFANITKKEFFCGNSCFTRSFYYKEFETKERGKYWQVVCIHPLSFLTLSNEEKQTLNYSGPYRKYLGYWNGDEIAVYNEKDPAIQYLNQNYTEIFPSFIPTKGFDRISQKYHTKR